MNTSSSAPKTTKGERIITLATVESKGHSCIGMMPWETPFVRFTLPDGRSVRWHSDHAAKAVETLKEGATVSLKAYLYGKNLRRVSYTI